MIVSDIDGSKRDVIVQSRGGLVKCISEMHPLYLALQYPLIFPYAKDGYKLEILHQDQPESLAKRKTKLTWREFFAFRLQDQLNEFSILMNSWRLSQQFIVNAYTMIEAN